MVRFLWHVEGNEHAYLPPGAFCSQKDSSVRHAACDIEVQGTKETLQAQLTLPANYLDIDKVRQTGIVLGHGCNASEWKGKLLTELAVILASQGYVVIRYHCKQKEQRRQRMFEKALDACATSPFARGVSRWVLAGFGSGARVAAVVASRCRGTIAGLVLLSYPIKEELPVPAKARRGEDELLPQPASSEEPLMHEKLTQPVLFLLGDHDEYCSPKDLNDAAARMHSSDIRAELFSDANQDFKSATQQRGPAISTIRRLGNCVLDFVNALEEGALDACKLGRPKDILPQLAPAEAKSNPAAVQQAIQPPGVSTSAQQPVQAVGLQSGQLVQQALAPSGPVQSAQQGHVQAQRAHQPPAQYQPHQPPAQFQPQAFPQGLAQSLLLPGAAQLPQMYQQMPQLYQQLSQQMLGAQVQALLGSQQAAQGTAGADSNQQLRPQLGGMPGQPPPHLLHQLLMQFPQRPSPQAGMLEGGQLRRPAGGAPAAQPATVSSWALPNGVAPQGTQGASCSGQLPAQQPASGAQYPGSWAQPAAQHAAAGSGLSGMVPGLLQPPAQMGGPASIQSSWLPRPVPEGQSMPIPATGHPAAQHAVPLNVQPGQAG